MSEVEATVEATQEWVRAADAARMLGLSRERVRQLVAVNLLEGKREERRQVWVSMQSITARMQRAKQPQSDT